MNEDVTAKRITIQRRPPATGPRVVLTLTIPGKVYCRLPISSRESAIKPFPNGAKLELALTILAEFNVRGDDQVSILVIPQLHLCDSPTADERIALWHHRGVIAASRARLTGGGSAASSEPTARRESATRGF